jgi:hypothetical protein
MVGTRSRVDINDLGPDLDHAGHTSAACGATLEVLGRRLPHLQSCCSTKGTVA